jgi:hypothetical protein
MTLVRTDKHGNPDKEEMANLENALNELCSASLKLALRFRSSKTMYEFFKYGDNTSLAACGDDKVKMLDAEGPISRPLDKNKLRIFCTLFGALLKTRQPLPGEESETVVLEPGQIIVYEPQLRDIPRDAHETA